MKAIITLFITMVVLNPILSESYDLVNGTEKQISELKTKENYKLYIEAIKYYGATISLAMKSTSSEPLNYIYVYEYSKNITLRYLRKNSYSVSTKKINNELIFSLDYLVDDQNAKYLAIEIIPDYDMDYMKIKIDLEQTVYDLTDGVPQKIKLLKKEYSYYLYIKSTECQSDLFRIITYKNKMNSKFYVYEFNEKSLYYTKPTQVDVEYSIEDGNNVVSFKYFTKNYETQYVALELQPNYDIEIEVTVDVVGGAFDLSKNVSKKVNNLRESVFYFFYFPSNKYYSQTFNLTMNYMTTQPFEMLLIYEFPTRHSIWSVEVKRQYITPTKKDNELFYSFVYQTKNSQTQYIGIRITPDYNFNYITVSYDSENCLYDLATGIPLNITSIKAGYEYYFFLPNTIYQNDSITLTMNSMNNNPLSYVYIYEYESKSSTEYLKNTSHSVTTSIKDNELISTFAYYVNNKKTQYIVLQLKPNYNMNYFTIKIDIEGGTYHLSNNIPLNITNLKSGFAYYFFISSTKFKNNKIDLKMNNMNKQPFSFLDIYEYVNIEFNYTKLTSQQITTKIENDEFISSFAYSIDNYNTNYIALKIIPDYDINNLTVKINIEEGLYDLSNGIPLNVTNLKSGNTYNFFFESTIYHIALINLTMKYMNNQPFSYVNIYEYSNKSSSNGNITQSITTSIKNDELISNFTYSIKNYATKYMILEIQPAYDIDYIVVKIDEQNCLYQLSNYDLQNIKNVKAGFTYYFIISSTQYENVFFSLTMNNDINTKPFSYVDIDEYSSSNIIPSSILHSINQSITTSTKNDELLSKFVYSVNDAKTKFVGLKIIPNNDLNNLGVQIYVENNKYEVEYEEEKSPIFSLKSGAKYYVFMEMRNEKKVKITLTMNNNIYTSPFSSIVIYELYNQDSININTNKVYLDKQDIANENGDSVISFSYECSRSYTSKIVLEITPNYDIDYLITEFKYSFTLPIGLIIFFLILGIIIVLIIIMCLVRRCKRRQNSSDKIDRLLMDI